jgi:hypothetical protein
MKMGESLFLYLEDQANTARNRHCFILPQLRNKYPSFQLCNSVNSMRTSWILIGVNNDAFFFLRFKLAISNFDMTILMQFRQNPVINLV